MRRSHPKSSRASAAAKPQREARLRLRAYRKDVSGPSFGTLRAPAEERLVGMGDEVGPWPEEKSNSAR